MKRDLDLVRSILLRLEEDATCAATGIPAIDGFDEDTVGFHCHLMAQAELILALDLGSTADGLPKWMPTSITWDGYEFLATARDKSLWQTATKRLAGGLQQVGFDLLSAWLKQEARQRLGLPL